MSADDRQRWDQRYEGSLVPNPRIPDGFADFESFLPTVGTALDVACGAGGGAIWLAQRGLDVFGCDASSVAIELADRAAATHGVDERCRFTVHDLDLGLPPGAPVDLVTCHLFSAPGLDRELLARLRPGGLLAMTVLSEVDSEPGPFRAGPGELLSRFESAEVLGHAEGDGRASIIVRAAGPLAPGRLD